MGNTAISGGKMDIWRGRMKSVDRKSLETPGVGHITLLNKTGIF